MNSFVDIIKPADKSRLFTFNLLCVLCGSLFLAALAQISLPLWFTPIPITLQTLGVMLIGALLGSKRGLITILAYLAEGFLGLPFFAGGGYGVARLIGPAGGYLFGFVISAYMIGYLIEKGWRNSFLLTLLAFSIGSLIILAVGALGLSFHVGVSNALFMGVYPFLIGSALKTIAAALITHSGYKFIKARKFDKTIGS